MEDEMRKPYCEPDYAPLGPHIHLDAMSHFGADIRCHDLQQLAKYPVDGSQLAEARASLKADEPMAHFSRHLVIPNIRFGDWAADASEGATQPH